MADKPSKEAMEKATAIVNEYGLPMMSHARVLKVQIALAIDAAGERAIEEAAKIIAYYDTCGQIEPELHGGDCPAQIARAVLDLAQKEKPDPLPADHCVYCGGAHREGSDHDATTFEKYLKGPRP